MYEATLPALPLPLPTTGSILLVTGNPSSIGTVGNPGNFAYYPAGQTLYYTANGTTWTAALAAGGGSGTVTSFSAGALSPLFTTSVATATVTPALSFSLNTQTAGTFFAGPTSGGAVAPTFRAMVAADLGTALAPQFARAGFGVAADAAIQINALRGSAGAGVAVQVAQFDATTSDPYITVGKNVAGQGGYIIYTRSDSSLNFALGGEAGLKITSGGNLTLPAGAVYSIGGTPGVSGTINATNTATVVGGIITAIV